MAMDESGKKKADNVTGVGGGPCSGPRPARKPRNGDTTATEKSEPVVVAEPKKKKEAPKKKPAPKKKVVRGPHAISQPFSSERASFWEPLSSSSAQRQRQAHFFLSP